MLNMSFSIAPVGLRQRLALTVIFLLPVTLLSQTPTLAPALVPMPREMKPAGDIVLSAGLRVSVPGADADDQFAAADLTEMLLARGIPAAFSSGSITVELLRASSDAAQQRLKAAGLSFVPAMQAEGYAIVPGNGTLSVIAATPEGIFYGVQTVKQLIDGDGQKAILHTATIRDWPAVHWRGLQDDLSRGPVTTLEFQKKQIRTLAAYKVNLYSPYFEHTFAYASNPLIAPPGGAITPQDALALVAYAKQYHITIVPEQESFGHLHHVLTWEQYAPLAETPHGDVLAPGQPGSLPLIHQWFTELAAVYPGPFLHIGADETEDLGKGQTTADVDARGLGAVYLDFLQRIVTDLQPLHRKLLYWGDVPVTDPELYKGLPAAFKQNTIAVLWTYNPEPKGFVRFIKPFTEAGIETWVAPGVNNWSRVYPNNYYALQNIQGFVRDGQSMGSAGVLNTVWNDDGEGLFNMDWYGVLFGAAASWQQGESSIPHFQQSYGAVFHGDYTGCLNEAQNELVLAHQLLHDQAKTGDGSDGLFWIDPWSKDGQNMADKIRPYTHELRMHAERALLLIAQARAAAAANGTALRETDAIDALELGARRMDLIGLKFQLSDEIASGYARAYAEQGARDKRKDVVRELSEVNGVNGRIQDLRDGYSFTRDLYEQAWLRSNRPYWLRNVLERYDMTIQLWMARGDRVRVAQRQWQNTYTLPPAADIGLPLPSAATN